MFWYVLEIGGRLEKTTKIRKKTSWLFKFIIGTIVFFICVGKFVDYKHNTLSTEVRSYCGKNLIGKTTEEIKNDAQVRGYETTEYTFGKVHGISLMKSFMLFSRYFCSVELEGEIVVKAEYGHLD